MNKSILLLTTVLLWIIPAYAHTYWIHTDRYFLTAGDEVTVLICGGHDFPESAFALGGKVLCESAAFVNGNKINYETAIHGKSRIGAFRTKNKGVYLLTFILKRPRDTVPRFESKAILHVDSAPKEVMAYRLGTGLEIIPAQSLAGKKKGDNLEFKVLFNGIPVGAKCTVTPEGKKSLYLNATKGGGFSVKVGRNCAYLLTASYKGRGCSLTFRLNPKTP